MKQAVTAAAVFGLAWGFWGGHVPPPSDEFMKPKSATSTA